MPGALRVRLSAGSCLRTRHPYAFGPIVIAPGRNWEALILVESKRGTTRAWPMYPWQSRALDDDDPRGLVNDVAAVLKWTSCLNATVSENRRR